jgi:2-oxoglutarate dehydrogenase complex dehydrogenase (E1) component-like enzyme
MVRIEELSPEKELEAELERYAGAEVARVKEEPENMGAW